MYVSSRMSKKPFVLHPENSVSEAFELFKEKKITRAPVVDKENNLVGMITHKKLLEISPSPATTLSMYEINYLLNKTKIKDLMIKNVISVTPDTLIEETAVIMRENKMGGIPVVEGTKVVGIITEGDIFDSFIEIMGLKDKGTRISVKILEDKPGTIEKLTKIIADENINISHLVVIENEIIIKLDALEVDAMIDKIKELEFKDIDVKQYFNE